MAFDFFDKAVVHPAKSDFCVIESLNECGVLRQLFAASLRYDQSGGSASAIQSGRNGTTLWLYDRLGRRLLPNKDQLVRNSLIVHFHSLQLYS